MKKRLNSRSINKVFAAKFSVNRPTSRFSSSSQGSHNLKSLPRLKMFSKIRLICSNDENMWEWFSSSIQILSLPAVYSLCLTHRIRPFHISAVIIFIVFAVTSHHELWLVFVPFMNVTGLKSRNHVWLCVNSVAASCADVRSDRTSLSSVRWCWPVVLICVVSNVHAGHVTAACGRWKLHVASCMTRIKDAELPYL